MGIAGWLWADLLLGAFVIFAVANTGGPGASERAQATPTEGPAASATAAATTIPAATAVPTAAAPSPGLPGVDPVHLEVTIPVNGAAILSGDAAAVAAEQERMLAAATRAAGSRRVALVFAYGNHQDATAGERLAALATARLRTGAFEGATLNSFHNLVAGDRGSSVLLSLYFFR